MRKEKKIGTGTNLSWLYSISRKYAGRITVLIVLVSVDSLFALIGAVIWKYLIDSATSKDANNFVHFTILLISLVLVQIVCHIIAQYVQETTKSRISMSLRQRLFGNLLSKDFTSVREKHSAEWLNRITADVETVSDSITVILPKIVGSAIRLIGGFIIVVRVLPWLILLILAFSVALALFGYLFKTPFKKCRKAVRDADGNQQSFVIEHLSNLMIVKAFNRESVITENAEKLGDKVYERHRDNARLSALIGLFRQIGVRGIYHLAVIYGCYLILLGRISFGTFTMVTRLVMHIRDPLIESASYLTSYYELLVSIERLAEAESFKDDPAVPVKSDKYIQSFYENDFSDIALEHVGFVYRDNYHDGSGNRNPIVFSDVNLAIPKKSCIAITGITGSGKSTLFKVLMSLYPIDTGRCVIRTKDGKEIDLDESYRRLFAYVPQGNQLMSGSIREIVAFGNQADFDRTEDIRKVLDDACALTFIDELPDGIDTVIKEKGLGLSEGQLQRIAIARALFTERPILLLDEATSSLDEKTEELILQNLKNMTDRTILIVTHRPAALSICDYEVHISGENVSMCEMDHQGSSHHL